MKHSMQISESIGLGTILALSGGFMDAYSYIERGKVFANAQTGNAGQPWKAQYWLRQVMNKMYTPGPDGYCGDEDNGQTSAWYVFSALGFYPVAPGTTQYVLGAPLFKKATIHFENGNNLVINAPNNSDKNIYIESMTFNGKNYTKNYLDHNDLFKGGVIDFKMGDKPNMNRGINPEDMPYSFSVNEEGINKLSPISVKPSKKKK